MRKRLTQKQETFCLKYFELGNATEAAIQAGYKPKTAQQMASENLLKPVIQARIQELRQKVEDAAIMNVSERQRKLSVIARARLTDFMELGQDGSWVNLGPEVPMSGAIQEIRSRTEYDDKGARPTVYTSVKLHNPLQAIDLLNKMDKLYSPEAQVNIDDRKIEIIVVDEEARKLTEQIIRGERSRGDAEGQSL